MHNPEKKILNIVYTPLKYADFKWISKHNY